MILQIISTLIALLIYNGIIKLIKIFFVKKTKNTYENLFENVQKIFPFEIDKDFWSDK